MANGLGEGAILVANEKGNFEAGDLIVSSIINGYGVLQDDDLLHNYTVAKILEDCDFTSTESYNINSNGEKDENGIYKAQLVSCIYMCS